MSNNLETNIKNWESTLKKTKDPVQAAELVYKIKNAKKELDNENQHKQETIITRVDGPFIADRTNPVSLTRGQIMNCDDVFNIII